MLFMVAAFGVFLLVSARVQAATTPAKSSQIVFIVETVSQKNVFTVLSRFDSVRRKLFSFVIVGGSKAMKSCKRAVPDSDRTERVQLAH